MEVELFAGRRGQRTSTRRAITWFDRFFGDVETVEPNDTEPPVDDRRAAATSTSSSSPSTPGTPWSPCSSTTTTASSALVAERGIDGTTEETYENGVRKAIFRDPGRQRARGRRRAELEREQRREAAVAGAGRRRGRAVSERASPSRWSSTRARRT